MTRDDLARIEFAALALLACACSPAYPDARHAHVVSPAVDVGPAAAWWGAATGGDVEFVLSDRCDDEHACVTVERVPHVDGGLAATTPWTDSEGRSGAWIRVSSDVPEALLDVVLAHELGHALGLGHVADPRDVMRAGGDGPACVGPKSLGEYEARYGVRGKVVCE